MGNSVYHGFWYINSGTIDNNVAIANWDTIENFGGTIDNSGTIINSGTINNYGGGIIDNSGAIINWGTMNNLCGGSILGTGTIAPNSYNQVQNESCGAILNSS